MEYRLVYGTGISDGSRSTKDLLTIKPAKFDLLAKNFYSSQDGEFVINFDKNSNSTLDRFKLLYGAEKKQILTAGKNDVTISTDLYVKNGNIDTKNINANKIILTQFK